jgi:xanthine dehydrogenase molybdenum-binding subunit
MTTASRGSFLTCHAVRDAARKLRADLDSGRGLEDLVGRKYQGEVIFSHTTALNAPVEKPVTHVAFSYATQVVILDERGRLQKVIAAHDVGKALNPLICESQIQGAVHMGLGYALTEKLHVVDGIPQNTRLRSLGLLLPTDMPEIEVILIEEPDPAGPYGAKGVGEIGLVPTAGAVQGALHAFDGFRRFELPMEDSPAARAIKA